MEKNSLVFFSSKIAQILLVIQINIMKNLQVSADGHSRKKKQPVKPTNQRNQSITTVRYFKRKQHWGKHSYRKCFSKQK